MRRFLAFLLFVVACTACTEDQLRWWQTATPSERTAATEHVIREAAAEYGVDPDLLTAIIRCESHLDPGARNRSSGALGLGQHLPSLWGNRAARLGYGYDSWLDPVANSRVTAMLLSEQGTRPWNSSRRCWGGS